MPKEQANDLATLNQMILDARCIIMLMTKTREQEQALDIVADLLSEAYDNVKRLR